MDNNSTTNTTTDTQSPSLGRRLATKLVVSAGTVGVVLLTSDSFVLAKLRDAAERRPK